MTSRRVGVLGGTFDPPHVGHVGLGVAACTALGLDEVWLTPAVPYHKGAAVASGAHRVHMCALAAASAPVPMRVCTVDVDRGGPTYTVDTLTELAVAHPGVEWVFVAGSDVITSMHTWGPSAQRCLELATFAAVHRPGFAPPALPGSLTGRVEVFDGSGMVEVSSSRLRDRLAARRGPAAGDVELVAALGGPVASHIDAHDLYLVSPARFTETVGEVAVRG